MAMKLRKQKSHPESHTYIHIGRLSQLLTAFLEEMPLCDRSHQTILKVKLYVVIKIFRFLILKRDVLYHLMPLNKGIA